MQITSPIVATIFLTTLLGFDSALYAQTVTIGSGKESAPTRCEILTANPIDTQRRQEMRGVAWDKIDTKQAIPACAASVAAFPNNPALLYSYGRALSAAGRYGDAIPFFSKAGEMQYAIASLNLARMLMDGGVVNKDPVNAFRWFVAADKQGSPFAARQIGISLLNGQGVEVDMGNAFKWFIRSDQLGDKEAASLIGNAYLFGLGVRTDYSLAWQWFKKGADAGDPAALTWAGYLLKRGAGVERNYKLSFEYYSRAASLGYAEAMYNLSICYSGDVDCGDITRDDERAVKWAKAGANLNNPRALRQMGLLFSRGAGVTKNNEIAMDWYRKAIAGGDKIAQDLMNELMPSPSRYSGVPEPECDSSCQVGRSSTQRNENARDWANQRPGRDSSDYMGN